AGTPSASDSLRALWFTTSRHLGLFAPWCWRKRRPDGEHGRATMTSTDLTREEEDLYRRVAEIIEAARSHVARSVNTAMVHAYWHVGRELVEVEQQGKARADYGERLIANLAKRLSERFGRGMGVATLRRIRRFYLTYPTGTAMPSDVSDLDNTVDRISGARKTVSSVDRIWPRPCALPARSWVEPLPRAHPRPGRPCPRLLRDRGRQGELVGSRAGAAGRIPPVRAAGEEPQKGRGPGARQAGADNHRPEGCREGPVRPRVPRPAGTLRVARARPRAGDHRSPRVVPA